MRLNFFNYKAPIAFIAFCVAISRAQQTFAITTKMHLNEMYARQMLLNVNHSVDPCADFYAYACGNWSANYKQHNEYLDMPGFMDYKVNKQLLEALQQHRDEHAVFGESWKYFASCANLTAPAVNYFLHALEPELQLEWPIFRANLSHPWQNESHYDWLSTLAVLRRYGFNGIFLTQNINVRVTNGSHYLNELHQHQNMQGTLQAHEIQSLYINFGLSAEQAATLSANVINLENEMLNLTVTLAKQVTIYDSGELTDDNLPKKRTLDELTLSELIEKIPIIDWRRYLALILESEVSAATVLQIFELTLDYFNALRRTLEQTTNETICNYIMLKFMYFINADLPLTVANDREITCIAHMRSDMSLAMNLLYEVHYYKTKRNATDSALLEIYERLRANFKRLILQEDNLKLNASEQQFILSELQSMRLKIGNVPRELSSDWVGAYYGGVNMYADDFYGNKLQLLKHRNQREQLKLQNTPIAAVEHFYEFNERHTPRSSSPVKLFDNVILLPHGYLQLPFYDAALHPLWQYSLLGFIVAHEIVHAFDLFHIAYDAYGNHNALGIEISQHFEEFILCYQQYESDLLSENMADVAGLRLAYETYFVEKNNELRDTEQLEFVHTNHTKEQLFFMNSVQFLCANMPKIMSTNSTEFNLEHDMHDKRVRRNWANYAAFADAFHCQHETNMNPVKRCRLW